MTRPARTEPRTAMVPAASPTAVTTAALATSMVDRRGIAVIVLRIMPLLHSPVITSTARTATVAWPSMIRAQLRPLRVQRIPQARPAGQHVGPHASLLRSRYPATARAGRAADPPEWITGPPGA